MADTMAEKAWYVAMIRLELWVIAGDMLNNNFI
jgi:hypothetical protein